MKPADFQYWRNKKRWNIYQLAFLLKELEPVELSELKTEDKRQMDQWIRDLNDFAANDQDVWCWEPGKIEPTAPKAPVSSTKLLVWAKNLEGVNIPSKLSSLLPEYGIQKKTLKWGYKHDTKLLKLCRRVIENEWEGKNYKKAPSRESIINELVENHGLSKRAAEAIDSVTRHDALKKQ